MTITAEVVAYAARQLAQPTRLVPVLPGRFHLLTLAEEVVLTTAPVQRLSRLRQTGLGFLAHPTAEHSRLTHSVGTAYWATTMLAAMSQRGGLTAERLRAVGSTLDPGIELDILARVFALVHDAGLLPLGHTLGPQLGYFANAFGGVAREANHVDRLRDEVAASPALVAIAEPEVRDAARLLLDRHLSMVGGDAVERAGAARAFLADLVTGAISADLVDFATRDHLGMGVTLAVDDRLFAALEVCDAPGDQPQPTVGTHALRQPHEAAVMAAIMALLRARYTIFEQLLYHPTKQAADATFDRLVRNTGAFSTPAAAKRAGLGTSRLLDMGDDQLVDALVALEASTTMGRQLTLAGHALRAGRLFTEVFTAASVDQLGPRGQQLVQACSRPSGRDALEAAVADAVPGLQSTDLAVSGRPPAMQDKVAGTVVGFDRGQPVRLDELDPATAWGRELRALSDRYRRLWSFSVYLSMQAAHRRDAVRSVCAALLG